MRVPISGSVAGAQLVGLRRAQQRVATDEVPPIVYERQVLDRGPAGVIDCEDLRGRGVREWLRRSGPSQLNPEPLGAPDERRR